MAGQADIQFHYDADQGLFAAMLGRSMAYSGANWEDARTLDAAQAAKFAKILRFAGVDGHTASLVDIGCGWGGLLAHAAAQHPALTRLTGLTLSPAQRDYAAGQPSPTPLTVRLADCFDFLDETGATFDAAVSVGAFEHFADGAAYRAGRHIGRYERFFAGCRRRVHGGLGLQTIVSSRKLRDLALDQRGAYLRFLSFLNREIFPNSLLPTVADIETAAAGHYRIEQLDVTTANYVKTLGCWRDNLEAAGERVPPATAQRFHRYLALCIEQFEAGNIGLAQIALRPQA